jgi:hypothetical protein
VRAALAAVLVALTACGGSAAQPARGPASAPSVVTLKHDGGTFSLRVGRDVEIHLPQRGWIGGKATSRAVDVYTVNFW